MINIFLLIKYHMYFFGATFGLVFLSFSLSSLFADPIISFLVIRNLSACCKGFKCSSSRSLLSLFLPKTAVVA